MTELRERRKVRVGLVVSDKMDKTVVVAVERRRHHRLYGKAVRRATRFKVHDLDNRCRVGDRVRIVETRPLSKTKRWRVVEVISRREELGVTPVEAIGPEAAELAPRPPAEEASKTQKEATEAAPVEEPVEEPAAGSSGEAEAGAPATEAPQATASLEAEEEKQVEVVEEPGMEAPEAGAEAEREEER